MGRAGPVSKHLFCGICQNYYCLDAPRVLPKHEHVFARTAITLAEQCTCKASQFRIALSLHQSLTEKFN